MKKIVLLLGLVLFVSISKSQIAITGIVSFEQKPVKDVKVSIKETNVSTQTKADGSYSIDLPIGYNTLVFEKTGFKVNQIKLNGDEKTVNISLSQLTGSEIFELTLEDLMNLTVTTVSKRSEPLNQTPQTIVVLTAEELTRRGYTDIEQVFYDLPGFDITRGSGTEYTTIFQRGYRSNNTNRTLVLIDGVEQNDLWSNSAWISLQHSLSNVKQIEVIYGPSSTIYGPNAFLGVVNIITKDADDMNFDKPLSLNAQFTYGSWNSKCADVTLSTKFKNFEWVVSGRYYNTKMPDFSKYSEWNYDLNDFDLNYYKHILGNASDSLALLARNLDSVAFFHDKVLNGVLPQFSNDKNDWLVYSKIKIDGFTLGIETYRLFEGYGGWYTDKYELGPKNGGSWGPFNTSIYSKFDKKISDKLSFSTFTTFNSHQLKGNDNVELYYTGYLNGGMTLSDLLQQADTTITFNNTTHSLDTSINKKSQTPYWWKGWYNTYSQQLRSEVRFIYDPLLNLNFITGIEYRQSHIQGDYLVSSKENPEETAKSVNILGGNHFSIQDFGVFVQGTYTFVENLKLVAGARIDYNKVRINGGYGFSINPKAALIFSPKNIVLKIIYSEAIKDATMWDKYGTIPGRQLNNPNLEPEKVKNIEFAAYFQLSNSFMFDFSAYNSNYSNVIGTAQVSFVNSNGDTVYTTQHQGIGKYRIQGVMGNLNFYAKNLNIFANFTVTNPHKINDDGSLTRIGDIATFNANLGLNYVFFKKLNFNIRVNYVGDRPTGSQTTVSSNPLSNIDAHFLLNSALTYELTKHFTIQATAFNLLNTEYFYPGVRSANGDYYASKIPGYERNFYLRLIVKI